MSCVTCEITPPVERQSATRVHEAHIGARFGDGGLGWHITHNGRNVTLQTVEAVAGQDGWVELHLLTEDGAPYEHPAADPTCPACGAPREPISTDPWEGDETGGSEHWAVCAECGNSDRPTRAYPAHPKTVIRRGHVTITHGTHTLQATQPEVAP